MGRVVSMKRSEMAFVHGKSKSEKKIFKSSSFFS